MPWISHQGEQHDGKHKDDQQKAGAATGMQRGKAARVFRGERQVMLVAVNGFVLRPVILERASHIGAPCAKKDVADENEDAAKDR